MEQTEYLNPFNVDSYSRVYLVNGKYVGSVEIKEKDREEFGYYGRKTEILTEDLVLKSKTIKKGTEVVTELEMVCGKRK